MPVAGQNTAGLRRQTRIALTTDLGEWSSKLHQAFETNDLAKTVTIELGGGHALTMRSAFVTAIRMRTDTSGKVVEEVTFMAMDVDMK